MKDTKEEVKDIRWILDVTLTFMSIELLGVSTEYSFSYSLNSIFSKRNVI